MSLPIITVDGPGGAGKGTLCRALAKHFGWAYLDSGALYRILAYAAAEQKVAAEDAAALVPQLDIRFAIDSNEVFLNEEPVASKIRTEEAGAMASKVAAVPSVRTALLQKQRDFASDAGLIADGRDMGTVIFPDAPLKIFLDASAEERARRRERELLQAGKNVIFEKIFREISERDDRDRNRPVAPLKPADDAYVLDSTGKDAEQVLNMALEMAQKVGLK